MRESVQLTRDCEASQIPSGAPVLLPKGAHVVITQALGGSYTVMSDNGYMLRVASENADALGKTKETDSKPVSTAANKTPSLEDLIWNQLRTCYDPEIPVNIVELGLVYECKLTPLPEGGHRVDVKMTLTAPGCGMGDSICKEAEAKIGRLPGIKQVSVQLVWEPPWDQTRMTEAAKLQLGMMS